MAWHGFTLWYVAVLCLLVAGVKMRASFNEHWERVYSAEYHVALGQREWKQSKFNLCVTHHRQQHPEEKGYPPHTHVHGPAVAAAYVDLAECGVWQMELDKYDAHDVAFKATIEEHKHHLPEWMWGESSWFSSYFSISFVEVIRANMWWWTMAFIVLIGFLSLLLVVVCYCMYKFVPTRVAAAAAVAAPAVAATATTPQHALGHDAETPVAAHDLQKAEELAGTGGEGEGEDLSRAPSPAMYTTAYTPLGTMSQVEAWVAEGPPAASVIEMRRGRMKGGV